MNFTPFGTTFSGGIPTGGAVAQFTTAKFAHNVGSTSGQVVGLLSSDEAGVTYLRPVDTNGFTLNLAAQQGGGNAAENSQQIITLPISVPGAKPGDMQQQTLQIQLVNPGGSGVATSGGEKFAVPISLQPFQQGSGATVLTVAYSNLQQDSNDPIQLQLQTEEGSQVSQQSNNNNNTNSNNNNNTNSNNVSSGTTTSTTSTGTQSSIHTSEIVLPDVKSISDDGNDNSPQAYPVAVVTHIPTDLILRADDGGQDKQGDSKDKESEKKDAATGAEGVGNYGTGLSWGSNAAVADYLSRLSNQSLPLSLHHYLKFSPETIKRESQIESSPLAQAEHQPTGEDPLDHQATSTNQQHALADDPSKVVKKKKKYKKKAPKPRKPRPGQIHIAFALDGTTLFCCPECNMAYPEKELLEQHLITHKIERRFICDICGAGLKRKEHLERHKLGHNPERPYICTVCCKGFKRKEHLNLHFVIHSGEKSEVCPECGKGFHRKDHLRKHARSHLTKRVKEETIVVGEDGQPLHADQSMDQPLILSQQH